MYDLTILTAPAVLLAQAVVDTGQDLTGESGSQTPWVTVSLAVIGAMSTMVLAWIGYLTQRNVKETRRNSEAIEETRASTVETERKLTSNHGRDAIGVKVDEIQEALGEIGEILPKLVDHAVTAAHEAKKASGRMDDFGTRMSHVEEVLKTAATQTADNAVVASVSFAQLNDTLDHLTVVEPTATIVPGPVAKMPYCRRQKCDGHCGRRHRTA